MLDELKDPAGKALKGDNADVLDEWKECRGTIARLDNSLEDLRKFGFTLITGLLAAGSFIGYGSGHPGAGVGAFVAVMCLIGALFGVDLYYSVMQSGAVERALDLEKSQKLRVTRYISHYAFKARSSEVILAFYLFLLAIASGLGVVSALASGKLSTALVLLTVILGALLFAAMLGYWVHVAHVTGMHGEKEARVWPVPDPFAE